jgi:membrane complex biogenesis BtpA family protein
MTIAWKDRLESHRLASLDSMFKVDKPVIGMVHLPPLPGSVGYAGESMQSIIDFALRDADRLLEGGVDGLIVENMWDLPYKVGKEVPHEEACAQAVAARKVVERCGGRVPVGVNVVHNGGTVVLSIAVAAGADFIRVCLLTGAQIWDTGELDHGCASELLKLRKYLQHERIKLFCDVDKKHSVRLPGIDLATHIEWTEFYLADALIVSGKMTGAAPEVDKVRRARELSHRPLLMGSGTNVQNVAGFLKYADGCIVGSSLKEEGGPEMPVSVAKVQEYMTVVKSLRRAATSSVRS